MRAFLMRRSCVIAITLCAAAIATALLVQHRGRASAAGSNDIAYTNDLTHQSPVAGDSPTAALAKLAAKSNGAVVGANLTKPPAVPGMRAGSWVHFLVAVPGQGQQSMRAQWEADLVVGAIADRLDHPSASVLGPLVGTTVDWKLPDGTILPDMGSGIGDVVGDQNFSSGGDSEVEASLRAGLSQANLTLVSIDIVRIDQPAPAVIVQTADPKAAAADAAATIRLLFGQTPPKYEGYYFEVRDSSGKPVLTQSTSFRSGAGRLWLSPTIEDVSSLHHL